MICVGIDVAKDKHDCFILSSEGEAEAACFLRQRSWFQLFTWHPFRLRSGATVWIGLLPLYFTRHSSDDVGDNLLVPLCRSPLCFPFG